MIAPKDLISHIWSSLISVVQGSLLFGNSSLCKHHNQEVLDSDNPLCRICNNNHSVSPCTKMNPVLLITTIMYLFHTLLCFLVLWYRVMFPLFFRVTSLALECHWNMMDISKITHINPLTYNNGTTMKQKKTIFCGYFMGYKFSPHILCQTVHSPGLVNVTA